MKQKFLFLTFRSQLNKALKWLLLIVIISALSGYGLFALFSEIFNNGTVKSFSHFTSLVSFGIPAAILYYQTNLIKKWGQKTFLILFSLSLGLFWFWMLCLFSGWAIFGCCIGALILFWISIQWGLRMKTSFPNNGLFPWFMMIIMLSLIAELALIMFIGKFSDNLIIVSSALVLWFCFCNAQTICMMKNRFEYAVLESELEKESIETALEMVINLLGMVWCASHVKFLLYFINKSEVDKRKIKEILKSLFPKN